MLRSSKKVLLMKLPLIAIPLIFMAMPACAQEATLPYATGSVQEFLKKNKAKKSPSVVLYNFNLESG